MDAESPSSNVPERTAKNLGKCRERIYRVFRFSILCLLGVLIFSTAINWIVSANTVSRYYCKTWGNNVALFHSRQGEIMIGHFVHRFHAFRQFVDDAPDDTSIEWNHASWERSYSIAEFDDRFEDLDLESNLYRVSVVRQIDMLSHINEGIKVEGYFSGSGIRFPHWIALLVSSLIFMLLWNGRQFSLRALLVWITIACVILGIAVRTSGDSASSKQESGQHGA